MHNILYGLSPKIKFYKHSNNIVGANGSHMFKLPWKRLGLISNLLCIDCIRTGWAQYPIRR